MAKANDTRSSSNESRALKKSRAVEAGELEIESGLTLIDELIQFVEDAKISEDCGQHVAQGTLSAILAMAQKSGSLIERGYGLTKGDGLGNGAGIFGSAEAWITDPSKRSIYRNLTRSICKEGGAA